MDIKNIVIAIVVSAIVASGSLALFDRPETVDRTVTNSVGAMASPEVYSYLRVHGAFTQGGLTKAVATEEASATTLEATDMMEYSILQISSNVDTTPTITLPATSTMKDAIIPTAGQSRTWLIGNASSSVSAMTIAAGAGIDLQEPDGQNIVIGANGFAWLTCYRLANTDVVCRADETIVAD